jgi:hypothetical protein
MILAGIPPAMAAEAPGGVQRVLILDSYGRDFAPYSSIASTFRTELAQRSANPIEFLEMSLETARFEEPEETAAVEYVRVLCERRKFDLVVPNGQPAARFWLRHREGLLPGTPTLFAAVDERHLSQLPLSPDEAVVATRLDLPGLLRHILQLLPGTTNVVVVIGNSPLEQFWLSELSREWSPFQDRVRITFLNELPFEEMLRRTAALPPHSAIFVALMLVDAAGVPHELAGAVDRLHASANAPLFGWSDDLLGHGIVGGPLLPLVSVGRDAALAAQRILAGERPGAVRSPVTGAGGSMTGGSCGAGTSRAAGSLPEARSCSASRRSSASTAGRFSRRWGSSPPRPWPSPGSWSFAAAAGRRWGRRSGWAGSSPTRGGCRSWGSWPRRWPTS